MTALLTSFSYGPILGLQARRAQRGFYMTPALNLVGREILGNLLIVQTDAPEEVYQRFSSQASLEEQIRFLDRQLKVAASFTDDAVNWINLLPDMLNNQTLAKWLESRLLERNQSFFRTSYRALVSRVGFEIVERGTLSPTAIAFLARLAREAGYPIALDDVGAPDGSFATSAQIAAMLKQIPARKLKIDGSLVVGRSPYEATAAVFDLLGAIEHKHRRSVVEVTLEGVPVNPHAQEIQPQQFVTERAQQLFARYQTNAEVWKWALHDLGQQLHVAITVQLAPVKYADFAQQELTL